MCRDDAGFVCMRAVALRELDSVFRDDLRKRSGSVESERCYLALCNSGLVDSVLRLAGLQDRRYKVRHLAPRGIVYEPCHAQ